MNGWMAQPIYVGIDLGGTSIKTGVVDAFGRLVHVHERRTEADRGVEHVIAGMMEAARQAVRECGYDWNRVAGIGAGIPGFIDMRAGLVRLSPNLRWKDVPVRRLLEEAAGLPVQILNDANAAALGEALSGAGAGCDPVVCFTIGTGIGSGIIIGGRVFEGAHGMAAEAGHMRVVPDPEAVKCGCGQIGCLETVSSATGIVRMAREAVEHARMDNRGGRTKLADLPRPLTARDVFEAARDGDEVAGAIVDRAALYLGRALAAVAVLINPQRMIIGGGVSAAGEMLIDLIRGHFAREAPGLYRESVDIVAAALGNHAGVVGAAGIFRMGGGPIG